jgi:tetratricopeptide (TPR) repeat protein
MRRRLALVLIATTCLAPVDRSIARTPTTAELLDQYARGDFGGVKSSLEQTTDFHDLLNHLKQSAPAWIAAAGQTHDRDRRVLVAATVALEAARIDERREWKLVQRYLPLDTIYWKAPPLLVDWGAKLFRDAGPPRPAERLWQLAAVAVAERSEDFEFLLGSPFEARSNPEDEIAYLTPLVHRFPDEPRFVLAQAIALSWRTWPASYRSTDGSHEAQESLKDLSEVDTVGPEAMVRLGEIHLRHGDATGALDLFTAADADTRDPYVAYLARFLSGQACEREHRSADAMAAYRRALEVVPGAPSASIALAAQLFLADDHVGAGRVVVASLSSAHAVVDPWQIFGDGDDRFWPELIARLRAEIAR